MRTRKPKPPADTPADVAAAFAHFAALMGDRATAADGPTLLMLSESWNTWRTARADVAKLGNVVMSGGTAIQNPSLAVAHQAHGQIIALLRELGLTAAARAKLPRVEQPAMLSLLRPNKQAAGG